MNWLDKLSNKFSDNTESFISKAISVHGNKYDYSKVEYKNTGTKVILICKEHGEFLQTPNEHLVGSGCIDCAGLRKKTTEEFIEDAKLFHGERYDYSEVNYKNKNSIKTNIIRCQFIICRISTFFYL